MNQFIESDMYLYVLNPALLNRDVYIGIEQAVEQNSDVRLQIEEIKEFYAALSDISGFESEYEYSLFPLTDSGSGRGWDRLAAQHLTENSEASEFVGTHISAEKLILTRLFFIRSLSEYHLYLLCQGNSERIQNALVHITGIDRMFITDELGLVKIKSGFVDENSFISVKFPILLYEIDLSMLKPGDTERQPNLRGDIPHSDLVVQFQENEINGFISTWMELVHGKLTVCVFEPGSEERFSLSEVIQGRFTIPENYKGVIRVMVIKA